jgi:spermidine synthase
MQLAKHLAQGRLVYLSQQQDAITVSENDYYRWMVFSEVVQSVMHKRKPWQLTLPHQIALLLPLLIFRPTRIIELGLGGGNLTRFLQHLSADIILTTIDHSQEVIDSFSQYFNPEKVDMDITCADGMTWLAQQDASDIDWIICDVYQSQELGFDCIVNQLEVLTSRLDSQACLSINLPDISDHDINLCLTILQQLQPEHHITYFNIPNYLNIVIHLTPKNWQLHRLIKRNKQSYLSQVTLQRWRKFWPNGLQLN